MDPKHRPFEAAGATWESWLSEKSTFLPNMLNAMSSTYWSLASLVDGNTYLDMYNYYKNTSSEQRAKDDVAALSGIIQGGVTYAPLGNISIPKNINVFSLNKGNGFNFKIKDYKVGLLYANESNPLTGTIFSVKQTKMGGNLLRYDYGPKHGSKTINTVHSTFRFNINGSTFGGTKQYPISASLFFYNYKQKK